MDGRHWLLAAALSAVAFAGMAALTARSEPGSPEPEGGAPEQAAPEAPALAAEGALSGCQGEVGPGGEDDEGFDIAAIASKVERLRGLRFDGEPKVRLVPVRGLDRRLAEEVEREYGPEDAAVDERTLELVGAIPPGSDLLELSAQSLEGQVAGAYLPETGELLVAEGGGGGAFERITLAHELEHALSDEQLGIPLPERVEDVSSDSLLARQALAEGSASLLMELYVIRHVGLGDLLDLGGSASFAEQDAELAELPYHLQRSLLWPYGAGARFACALYRRGGWRAVDRAFAKPPRSSDQVVFPERYGETPADPPDPGRLPPPWSRRDGDELGAAELMWLFEAPGGDPDRALPDPRGAVSAWGGGEAVLWTDGARSALGISLAERGEGPALCAAVAGWYAAVRPDDPRRAPRGDERLAISGPGRAAVLRCPAGQVRLGIAPALALARRLAG